jgi:hypothetical protein
VKRCPKCGLDKEAHEFAKEPQNKNGISSRCKMCRAEYAKAYYRNPVNLQIRKEQSANRWAARLLYGATRSSLARGHSPPTITEEWIIKQMDSQQWRCHWTGVLMVSCTSTRGLFKPSLDRLDGSCGYVPSNVVICCMAANFAKSSATVEELKLWLQAVKAV